MPLLSMQRCRTTSNPHTLQKPRRASQRVVRAFSSVLLCISTLLDGANHYTKMINLTDETGAKVFESLQISLVCGKTLFSQIIALVANPLTTPVLCCVFQTHV